MPLLFPDDYENLSQRGISWEEDSQQRFFIFKDYPLPPGVYTVPTCDILVVMPANYNQAGNDMFWTNPRLVRANGSAIPASNEPSGGDNRSFNGKEFCRWSRHWNAGTPGAWRPGKDDILSIQRRIEWALQHPDCK